MVMLGVTQVCLEVQLQNTCTASDEQPRLGSIQYRPPESMEHVGQVRPGHQLIGTM